jgi:hypothetical protein
VDDIERREENLNNMVCWRPSDSKPVNKALSAFFSSALKEFGEGQHYAEGGKCELASWRNPPSAVACRFKDAGVRYATNQELHKFFLRSARTDPSFEGIGGGGRDFVAGIVLDLPHIVTVRDVSRYVQMLENPKRGLAVRTTFPVKFAILPEPSDVDIEVNYTLALVPESARVGGRLRRTRYSGEKLTSGGLGQKFNHLPGALGYVMLSVYPNDRIGVQHEMQSDHDPRETRGIGIENWHDLLARAMHADYARLGVAYSLIPLLDFKMGHIKCPPEQLAGVREKMGRVYPSSDHVVLGYRPLSSVKPPGGYRSWAETLPFTIGEEKRGTPEDYLVRVI